MRNLLIDSQILDNIQLCAYKTDLQFNQRLQPEYKAESLERGDLLHTIFKVYYTLALHRPDLPHGRRVDIAISYGREHSIRLSLPDAEQDEVIFHCNEYFKFREGDYWIPTFVEKPFSKVLWESEEHDLRIIYEGIIDLGVLTRENIEGVVDHKSARKNSDTSYLSLGNNQFKGYSWALGVSDVIVNKVGFQKTLKPADRFVRVPISYSAEDIDNWVKNTIWWGQFLASCLENDTWPQNFTSCDKFNGCSFRKVCKENNLDARKWVLDREFIISEKRWSPHTRDSEEDGRMEQLIKEA